MQLNIGNDIKPQKSRLVSNLSSLNDMAHNVNVLRKLDFDANKFIVSKYGDGIHIGLKDATIADTSNVASVMHFDGEVVVTDIANSVGTITVHAGIGRKYFNNNVYKTKTTIDGGGTSEFYEDVLTLTNVVSSCYVYSEYDALIPTTLTIKKTAGDVYPVSDSNRYTIRPIGHVVANVTANAITYEVLDHGDWVDTGVVPDASSAATVTTDFRTTEFKCISATADTLGSLQIYDTSNSGSQTRALIIKSHYAAPAIEQTIWVPTDGTPMDCGNDKASESYDHTIVGSQDFINGTGLGYGLARSDHFHHIYSSDSADNATYALTANVANTVVTVGIGQVAHRELSDIIANNYDDDHHGTRIAIGATPAYIADSGDYSRNAMNTGLGNSMGDASVGVNDHKLYFGGQISVDWQEYLLNDSGAALSIDWDDKVLSGDWTVGSLVVDSATDITYGDGDTGALQVHGGGSFAKSLQILGNAAGSTTTGALYIPNGGALISGSTYSDEFHLTDGAPYNVNTWNHTELNVLTGTSITLFTTDFTHTISGTHTVNSKVFANLTDLYVINSEGNIIHLDVEKGWVKKA